MISALNYLRTQFKRSLKYYPAVIAVTMALIVCAGLLLFGIIANNEGKESKLKVKVGMVGEIEESHMGVGISMLQEIDSSRYYVEFVPLDTKEAEKRLKNGELLGYINVPEGFVDSVIDGENLPLTYIAGSDPSALTPLLIEEVLSLVSDLVLECQNGVYAMYDAGQNYGLEYSELRNGMEELNIRYFDAMFSREEAFTVKNIGTGKELGFGDYYMAAFFILLPLLWGIVCLPLETKRDMSLYRMLRSRGLSPFAQCVGDYIPFLLIIAIGTLLMLLCGNAVTAHLNMSLGIFGSANMVSSFISLLPAVILVTAMQFLLYELTSDLISTLLLQLISTIGLSFISGIFYPAGALPSILRNIGAVTPVGVAFDSIAALFNGYPGTADAFICLGYAAVILLCAALVRSIRIRSVGK